VKELEEALKEALPPQYFARYIYRVWLENADVPDNTSLASIILLFLRTYAAGEEHRRVVEAMLQ